ncbi:MAG: hypothetical protein WCX31_00225 [Salinivirgaceae bacterium]
MKRINSLSCVIILISITSCAQVDKGNNSTVDESKTVNESSIKKLIKTNLESRFTNAEIVSITPDSCPDMRNLFHLSLQLTIKSSETKRDIVNAFSRQQDGEINGDQTRAICNAELDTLKSLVEIWHHDYQFNKQKCFTVRYRYGTADGTKKTETDYYTLDETRYLEGNYAFLQKEFTYDYAFQYYEKSSEYYIELLREFAGY